MCNITIETVLSVGKWILVGAAAAVMIAYVLIFVLAVGMLCWITIFATQALSEEQHRMVLECTIPGVREKLALHNGCGCGNDTLRTLAEAFVPHLGRRSHRENKKLCNEINRLTQSNEFPSVNDCEWPIKCQLLHSLEDKSADPVYAMVSARVRTKDGATLHVHLPKIRVSGKWKFNGRTASSQYSSMLRRICKEAVVEAESPDLLCFYVANRKASELPETVDVGDGKCHVLFGGVGWMSHRRMPVRFHRTPGGWSVICCALPYSSIYGPQSIQYLFVSCAIYFSGSSL